MPSDLALLREARAILSRLDHLSHRAHNQQPPPDARLLHGLRMSLGWLDKTAQYWDQVTPQSPERLPSCWPTKAAH